MKTHEEIGGINFTLAGCKTLTRKSFDASYGDKDNNGKKKPNTHWNLNKSNLDRVWNTLQKALEDRKKAEDKIRSKNEAENKKKVDAKKKGSKK